MPKRLFPLLGALLALSAFAAGCGQAREADAPSASSAGGDGTPSKPEFVARAGAICERMTAESVAEAQKARSLSAEELGRRAVELQGRALRELRALPVPRGDEQRVGTVLLHLERLQQATRALVDAEGEDALPAVAAIAVETDAVARAAKRYGLFRGCGAYHESPEIQRILHPGDPGEQIARGPYGKPLKRLGPQNATRPLAVSPATEIRRLGAGLVPPGRRVVSRKFCGGGDLEPLPTCLILELAPQDKALALRLAEFERLVTRKGWNHARRVDGERSAEVLLLFRDSYNATVTLASPKCRDHTQMSDGPRPTPSVQRCFDRIMVLRTL
jgi:hypothetical protein